MSEKKFEPELSVDNCLELQTLPSYDFLYSLLQKACEILSGEITEYRPANCMEQPGSLLQLYQKDSRCLPVVIVPDIHARPDFLKNILNCPLPQMNMTVFQALKEKKIDLVCLGDAVHTELYAARWKLISLEFESGLHTGYFMQEEMILNLAVLTSLLALKISCPENFHFLKGNHENILNSNMGGDYAFCKYADEGEMVKLFIQEYYDDRMLSLIARYENLLPLVACGKNYVISHAEPAFSYSREELIDAKFEDEVVEGLIWTRNGQVKKSTARDIMKELLGKAAAKKALYFTGHRPVKDNFALRQEGALVQIHNPHRHNIALVEPDKEFDFEKNIINTRPRVSKKPGGN